MALKEEYTLANCCKPKKGDDIVGYRSYDESVKVHKSGCSNLNKVEPDRLMLLEWNLITEEEFKPANDYNDLTGFDFKILKHHQKYGVDYSLKIASMHHYDKQSVFDSHQKLRDMGLLERVKKLMIQYRKGIVDNKWIKHRNHTYYRLTEKGENYLKYYLDNSK